MAAGDFDGDGRDDLAVGAPLDSVNGHSDAGLVNAVYGAATGLTGAGNQIWQQDVDHVSGESEAGDQFGFSLAVGDFGRTAQDDLAVGVPFEDVESDDDAGAVNAIYGSGGGLATGGSQLWHQDVDGVEGGAERGDLFGASLAAGDFGKSSAMDLAVGVPGEDLEDIQAAGVVEVLYSDGAGLNVARDELWDQNVLRAGDSAETADSFGLTLAAGDFGHSAQSDLAVGVPFEDVGSGPIVDAGAVTVVYGASDGLSNTGDQLWTQAL